MSGITGGGDRAAATRHGGTRDPRAHPHAAGGQLLKPARRCASSSGMAAATPTRRRAGRRSAAVATARGCDATPSRWRHDRVCAARVAAGAPDGTLFFLTNGTCTFFSFPFILLPLCCSIRDVVREVNSGHGEDNEGSGAFVDAFKLES